MRGMDHSCATLLLKWCSDAGFTQCVQMSYLDDDDIEEKRDSGRAKNNPFAALALDGEDSDDSD